MAARRGTGPSAARCDSH